MDSFEFNKIAGAVLGTLLAVMALGIFSEVLIGSEEPEQPGWAVAVSEEGAGEEAAAEEQATPLPVLLASADAEAGAAVAKKCASCHTFEEGGANKVGPYLHGVVGRAIAAVSDFSYSGAFQEKAGEGFEWTYEHLDGFLANPRGYIDGTAMSFAGVKDDADRANLIAYLKQESPDAPPFPEPEAAPAGEASAEQPAEGEQAAEQPAQGEPAAPEQAQQQAAEQPAQQAPAQQPEGQQQQAEQAPQPQAQQQAQTQQPQQQDQAQAEQPAQDQAAAGGDSQLLAAVTATDVAAGEKEARKCQACHAFEKGGPNKVGPGLYGIVGAPVAGHEGYKYSGALQELGGEWTLERLDAFLADPRGYAKGTKMAFAGVKKDENRLALLHYLYTLQDNPQPAGQGDQGQAQQEAPAQEQAPAEQQAPEQQGQAQPAQQQAAAQPEGQQQAQQPAAQPQEAAQGQQDTEDELAAAQQRAEQQAMPQPEQQQAQAQAQAQQPQQGAQPAQQQAAAQPEGQQQQAPQQQAQAQQQEPAEAPAAGGGADPALVAAVAATDPADGEKQARKCQACHAFEKGGPNKVGPGLYGIVGAPVAGHEGYKYSKALQELGGDWTLDRLDAFLADPRGFAKGTKMAFAGLKKDEDRHALLHYLHTLQDNPQPLQ